MIFYTSGTNRVPIEIDNEDYEQISKYNWYSTNESYPWTSINGNPIRLHQFILGKAPQGLEWDHIDQNKLNNRRDNLQAKTHSKNLENRSPSLSGIPGICINSNCFVVHLPADMSNTGKKIYLGRVKTIEDGIDLQFFHYILHLEELDNLKIGGI